MKCLDRNKQPAYYALYQGKENILDEYGNVTGEVKVNYSEPQMVMMNVSASRGDASLDMFGIAINYSKALISSDITLPIAEDSILWVGKSPAGDAPHNFVVSAIAKSLNSVTYAVREVEVS